MFRPASLLLLTALMAACGSSDKSNSQQGTGIPAPGQSAKIEEVSSVLPPYLTARRDYSSLYRQFDIEQADVQMIHDVFTGRLAFDESDPQKSMSCVDLVQIYLSRIQELDRKPMYFGTTLNSVLHINDQALAQARELDRLFEQDKEAGFNEGLGERYLHCIPVLSKDNFDTFDHVSSSGSLSLLEHQAGIDAPSIAGLREAGAVIIGKANMSEFAFTPNPADPRNIGFSGYYSNAYNTSSSSGASSSGSGTATAARLATLTTGSDSCGSIRGPASAHGLAAVRPSIGVVSRKGIMPLYHYADTGGPITKSIRDAALMLTAMASNDPIDDFKTDDFPAEDRPANYVNFLGRSDEGLAGKNIGIFRSADGTDVTIGGEAFDLTMAAAQKMSELGANLYFVDLIDLAGSRTNTNSITTNPVNIDWYHYDVNQYFFEFFRDGGQSDRSCVSSSAKLIFNMAVHHPSCVGDEGLVESALVTSAFPIGYAASDADSTTTDEYYLDMKQQRDYWHAVMDGRLVDGMVEESGLAARVENLDGDAVDGIHLDVILQVNDGSNDHCSYAVQTEMGSVMVPIGYRDSGIPLSMALITRRFDEGTGLAIAYEYEQKIWDERQAAGEPLMTMPALTPFIPE